MALRKPSFANRRLAGKEAPTRFELVLSSFRRFAGMIDAYSTALLTGALLVGAARVSHTNAARRRYGRTRKAEKPIAVSPRPL
jgi:hypothetical protein